MSVSLDTIKELREATGVSMMACKKALEETGGDVTQALEYLRKKGAAKAVERGERSTGEGTIAMYLHQTGKIGVMVHLGCETDFVAKSEDFQQIAKDIAMHIAAMSPLVVSPDEVSPDLVAKEREIWTEQLKNEGKKEAMLEGILSGKEKKFREETALLKQAFLKNPEITIEQILSDAIQKLGENIRVVRFVRFAV